MEERKERERKEREEGEGGREEREEGERGRRERKEREEGERGRREGSTCARARARCGSTDAWGNNLMNCAERKRELLFGCDPCAILWSQTTMLPARIGICV
jgi:hypothetical protein